MRNKIEVEKVKIVTKDNFQTELKEFKNLLDSKLFDYVIINNDISTMSPKSNKQKESELIFSEFTICRKQNLESKDIKYTFTTFLVPSVKLHRYANDELVSFSSIFLKYLTNEKSVYDFNLINATNSLSYDNINKRPEFEKTLNRILIDGKPFKKENKSSYFYYPKAIIIPSKKFRTKFEDTVKFFIGQIFGENVKKAQNEDKTYLYENDKYESDFKFVNSFLNFKWLYIFDKIDNDKFKIFVNEYKIIFKNEDIGDISTFQDLVNKIKNFLDNKNDMDNFEIDIKKNDENALNDDILNNWKQMLLAEENIVEFEYDFNDDKIKFSIKADKTKENRNFQNIKTFLECIAKIPQELENKNDIEIKPIFYRRINMINLFPDKLRNSIEFNYHLVAKVNEEELQKIIEGKNKDDYLKKVSYDDIYFKKKNDEEILFGYKFEPQLKQLFDIKTEISTTKTISLEFGKDLEILIKDETFLDLMKNYFIEFKMDKEDKNFNNRTLHLNLKSGINFHKEKSEILKLAKEIKKNLLLDEEIGVSFFYNEVFKRKGIPIYGTNLKNKLYFPIQELILKPEQNSEEKVKELLDKLNIYDVSYICCKKNVDFYKKYIRIKNQEEFKERTMTQRLGYVIEEIDVLKNEDVLNEFKNSFYMDLDANKFGIKCPKEKLYENADEIFKVMKAKCDFIVNKGRNDSDVFELNVIDKEKFNNIDDIEKKINEIIS